MAASRLDLVGDIAFGLRLVGETRIGTAAAAGVCLCVYIFTAASPARVTVGMVAGVLALLVAIVDVSATVADVAGAPSGHDSHVEIVIRGEPGAPPSGTVAVDGGPARRFESWLGLLRLLAAALDPQSPAGVTGGLGGEIAPGGDAELGERV